MSGASTSSHNPPPMASITDVSALFQNAKKYEELNVIGTGAYGTVYKARDLHNGGNIVAMKKVKVALTEDGIPLSTLREIALLRQLEAYRHPNIVRLLDVCHGGQSLERDQQLVLFLVFEHVDQDLESFLKRSLSPLSQNTIRSMSYDILSGIDFLHSHRIVHRDLKPHNLLVTCSGRVKLADFGLAKTYDTDMKLTSVVVTLWYRPPEVLLGSSYNTAVDVWSAGCVLAQLHTRSDYESEYPQSRRSAAVVEVAKVQPKKKTTKRKASESTATSSEYKSRSDSDSECQQSGRSAAIVEVAKGHPKKKVTKRKASENTTTPSGYKSRKPLLPGASDSDQLHEIFRLIGRPSRQEWPENVSIMLDSFPEYQAQDLGEIIPRIHPHALDMIKGMLIFDPARRLTALDCLEHPYFTDEPIL